jgi:hypothetical protein
LNQVVPPALAAIRAAEPERADVLALAVTADIIGWQLQNYGQPIANAGAASIQKWQ